MVKCTAKKGGYAATLCDDMMSIAQHPSHKGGVKAVIVTNRSQFPVDENGNTDFSKETKLGLCLTIHKTTGRIVMKYCPFCGGELVDMNKAASADTEGKE